MILLDLPLELVIMIGEYSNSILSLILTCKALHHILRPILFSEIELNCPGVVYDYELYEVKNDSSGNLYTGLQAIAKLPKEDKHRLVHKLHIKSEGVLLPPLSETEIWYETRKAVNLLVCNALFNCNNLRELE